MSLSVDELLEARIALLERRLQFVSQEVAVALAHRVPDDESSGPRIDGDAGFPASVGFDADSLSQFAVGFYEREFDDFGQSLSLDRERTDL